MSEHNTIQLGVNVDHVATLRQARGVVYPEPMLAADIARKAGADGITVHLREDRRHIQDHDVYSIKGNIALPLNFEMAATDEMQKIALTVLPHEVCLVPEKRDELTTEGGLNVVDQLARLRDFISVLKDNDILVSLFVDPDLEQLEAAKNCGADIVELHTGSYADASVERECVELDKIRRAAKAGQDMGLQVNAGHGLHYRNVVSIAKIPEIECLNIGHAIVARAVMSGMYEAVFTMKQLLIGARLDAEGNGT